MSEQGLDVHLVGTPQADLLSRLAETENATAHGVFMTRAITPLADARSLFKLWRLLRRLSPDIVHAGTPKGGFLGMVAAFLLRVPVRIYHMHGIRSMTTRGWRRIVLLATERLACRLATRVLSVSPSVRATAIALGLSREDKMTVLGAGSCNGVDARGRFNPEAISPEKRRSLRAELNIPERAPVLGFVGRVARDKGVVELAQAWGTLAATFNDLYLLVVGPAETEDPVPARWLDTLQSHPRVRFAAAVTDPAPYYAIMDVVALPSYREGLPNVPLEAAAMHLPVVATRVDGCVDAVVDGETGTLVPPYRSEPLAEAISRYLLSPALRKTHGDSAHDRVVRDFAPEDLWKRVFGLYCTELDSVSQV